MHIVHLANLTSIYDVYLMSNRQIYMLYILVSKYAYYTFGKYTNFNITSCIFDV